MEERRRSPVVRALLVLVLFVVVTVLVLGDIHPTTTKAVAGRHVSTTTTTPVPPTPDHDDHHPTQQGTRAGGQRLRGHRGRRRGQRPTAAGGWALLPPTNASARVTASHVYYVAGFKQQSRRHRLVTAASGHLGGPVHHRGPDQLHRDGRSDSWSSGRTWLTRPAPPPPLTRADATPRRTRTGG